MFGSGYIFVQWIVIIGLFFISIIRLDRLK